MTKPKRWDDAKRLDDAEILTRYGELLWDASRLMRSDPEYFETMMNYANLLEHKAAGRAAKG